MYTQYLYFILYRNKYAQSFFELLCVSIKTEPVLWADSTTQIWDTER